MERPAATAAGIGCGTARPGCRLPRCRPPVVAGNLVGGAPHARHHGDVRGRAGRDDRRSADLCPDPLAGQGSVVRASSRTGPAGRLAPHPGRERARTDAHPCRPDPGRRRTAGPPQRLGRVLVGHPSPARCPHCSDRYHPAVRGRPDQCTYGPTTSVLRVVVLDPHRHLRRGVPDVRTSDPRRGALRRPAGPAGHLGRALSRHCCGRSHLAGAPSPAPHRTPSGQGALRGPRVARHGQRLVARPPSRRARGARRPVLPVPFSCPGTPEHRSSVLGIRSPPPEH